MANNLNYVEVFNKSNEVIYVELKEKTKLDNLEKSLKVGLSGGLPTCSPIGPAQIGINVENYKKTNPIPQTYEITPERKKLYKFSRVSFNYRYKDYATLTFKKDGENNGTVWRITSQCMFYFGNHYVDTCCEPLIFNDDLRITHYNTGQILKLIKSKNKSNPEAKLGPIADTYKLQPKLKTDDYKNDHLKCKSEVVIECCETLAHRYLTTCKKGIGKAYFGDYTRHPNQEEYIWELGKAPGLGSTKEDNKILNGDVITLANGIDTNNYLRARRTPNKMTIRSSKTNGKLDEYWVITKCVDFKQVVPESFNNDPDSEDNSDNLSDIMVDSDADSNY